MSEKTYNFDYLMECVNTNIDSQYKNSEIPQVDYNAKDELRK